MRKLRSIHIALFSLAAVFTFSGCAYFNTYYNARKLFNQAGRSRGDFPDTLQAGGAEAGLYQKSLEKFATVIAKYPSSRWAAPSLYHMAEATYRRGEYQKAQRLYEDVWEFYPDSKYSPRARLGFALACWKLKEYERAERALQSIPPSETDLLEHSAYLEAMISQAMGDITEAALRWESFLYQHPKSGLADRARYSRALCLVLLEDYSRAAAELEALLERRLRKAFRFQAQLLLARSLENGGRSAEALEHYRALAKTAVEQADVRNIALSIARIRASQTTPGEGRAVFREVAAKHTRTDASAGAYFAMAELWEMEGALDSAQACYNLARQESPGSPVAEQALRKASDIALLQAYSRQTTDDKTREQNAAIQFLMAEHYLFQLDQVDPAVEKYLQVSDAYPELAVAAKSLYAAGWARLSGLPDTAAADSLFSLLIERYPRTRYANAARERLGMPVDTTVSDSEPEIGMAIPVIAPQDTAAAQPAPADTSSSPDTKIPAPPQPDSPEGGLKDAPFFEDK